MVLFARISIRGNGFPSKSSTIARTGGVAFRLTHTELNDEQTMTNEGHSHSEASCESPADRVGAFPPYQQALGRMHDLAPSLHPSPPRRTATGTGRPSSERPCSCPAARRNAQRSGNKTAQPLLRFPPAREHRQPHSQLLRGRSTPLAARFCELDRAKLDRFQTAPITPPVIVSAIRSDRE